MKPKNCNSDNPLEVGRLFGPVFSRRAQEQKHEKAVIVATAAELNPYTSEQVHAECLQEVEQLHNVIVKALKTPLHKKVPEIELTINSETQSMSLDQVFSYLEDARQHEGAILSSVDLNFDQLKAKYHRRKWSRTGAALTGGAALVSLLAVTNSEISARRVTPEILVSGDVSGKTLYNRDYEDWQLDGANLADMNLSGSSFEGASLRNADLSGANLQNVNLTRADLTNANLSGANLQDADLRNATVTGAVLDDANLTNASMRFMVGSDASFLGTNLTGSDLYSAKLDGSEFNSSATLTGTNFASASLLGSELGGADLQYSKGLSALQIARAADEENSFCPGNIKCSDFSEAADESQGLENKDQQGWRSEYDRQLGN